VYYQGQRLKGFHVYEPHSSHVIFWLNKETYNSRIYIPSSSISYTPILSFFLRFSYTKSYKATICYTINESICRYVHQCVVRATVGLQLISLLLSWSIVTDVPVAAVQDIPQTMLLCKFVVLKCCIFWWNTDFTLRYCPVGCGCDTANRVPHAWLCYVYPIIWFMGFAVLCVIQFGWLEAGWLCDCNISLLFLVFA